MLITSRLNQTDLAWHGMADFVLRFGKNTFSQCKTGGSLDQRYKVRILTVHGIAFPITNTQPIINNVWALGYINSVGGSVSHLRLFDVSRLQRVLL
jgi:hypothetical protein